MSSSSVFRQLSTPVQAAYITIDQVDGAVFDAAHNKWIQVAPKPEAITVHARAVNQLQGTIDWAVIRATWVYGGVNPMNSDLFQLKSGESHAASFRLDPLNDGGTAALYLDLYKTNIPLAPNPKFEEVGISLLMRFETPGGLWNKIEVRQPL